MPYKYNPVTGKLDLVDASSGPVSTVTELIQQTVKAGVALTKGTAVYVSDADGTNVIVAKASNATEALSSKTLGLIAQDLALNGIGTVITEGRLAGLNTSAAQVKDPVWLGVNGQLIFGLTNKPVAPAHLVYLGVVTRVNANNGEIFVKVQNGYELDELHDVLIINPQDGDIIMRDNTGLWKNITAPFVSGSGTANYLPVLTDNKAIGNSAIYEDAGKIGIGTTSPLKKFHVKENAASFALEGTDHVYQEFYPQGVAAGRFGFIGYSQAGSGDFRFYNGPLGNDIDFVTNNQIRLVISKAGQVKINTINPASTDTDKFLVSDDGEIKYRTGDQLLSDIGAQGSLTLTTTGTGAATLNANTLNIPQTSSEKSGSILSTNRSLPFRMSTNITTYRSASGVGSTTTSSATFAGETTTFFPISLKEGSPVSALACRIYTAGSAGLGTAEIEFGIYNSTTDANGNLIPGTLEVQFGKVSTLTTGIKEAVLASPYTLGSTVDNIYWIAFRNYSTNSATLNTYSTGDVLSTWIGISSSTALVKLGSFIATTLRTAPTGLPTSLPVTGGVGFTQSDTVAGYTSSQALVGIR